jgi:predicted amidohydrolase
MADPYTVVGLIPTVRGIARRDEIQVNLDHIAEVMAAASWLSSLDLPVKLVAIPEGALQGFTDEVFDLDHERYAEECAIDIPGQETEFLGQLAKHWQVYLIAQAKARHPSFPQRFFNVGFIVDPNGEVILQHYKVAPLYPVEHSVTPFDVYDRWVSLYGETLEAFYPVVETPIGRLGIMMANEGSYPENARGLAMNGAEIIYRAAYPHPHTGNEFFEIQNRARALDNNVYIVAPNMGTYYLNREARLPIDTFGGQSMIVDYKGRIIGKQPYGSGSTYVAGTIDLDALRRFRVQARWDNWLKDLQTEQYRLIYQKPIYPKNLYLERAPYKHEEYRVKVSQPQIDKMVADGIWKRTQ